MTKTTLEVKGMYCAHCSKAVENALTQAGATASVNLSKNTVLISYDETKISLSYLARAVKRAGYELVIDEKKRFDYNRIALPISIFVLVCTLIGLIYHFGVENSFFFFFGNDLTFLILASISLVFLGIPFIIRAVKGLRYKNIGMDFLISFSALISYSLSLYIFIKNIQNGYMPWVSHMHHEGSSYQMGYFDTVNMILSIITFGHWLTDTVKLRADKNYKKAVLEPPSYANLIDEFEGTVSKVDVDSIDEGDRLKILAGETVPCDSLVVSGGGTVDESSMNGESKPRDISSGDHLLGGTLLLSGPVEVVCEKIALDSLYTSIINESYALDQRKGKLSRISDTIASIFTPAVILIALIAFLICYFGMDLGIETALIRAVSVLSVSCPCAFGLAVPLSSMSGYDVAFKNGVLFKSGDTFERVKNIKAVVFDKTGTLTTGNMKVTAYAGDASLIPVVKGMEANSLHPIARGILSSFPEIESENLDSVSEIPGLGLSYSGYMLGSQKTLQNKEISDEISAFVENNTAATLIYLSDEKRVLLALALEDEEASEARETILELKEKAIVSCMLSGDRKEYALQFAEKIGIGEEHVYYEADPKNKASILRDIREKEGVVCYVGDGINDTLALKESDLSFASYKASPVACSSADGLLMSESLYSLVYALNVSKKTYYNIIENFIWAIAYNIVMIPLAIMGILPASLCAALMIVSNLTLTVNSLRVKFYDPKKKKGEKQNEGNQSK